MLSTIHVLVLWCATHRAELAAAWAALSALGGVLVLALRAIPRPVYARLEARFPRLARVAKALRGAFPDVVKVARELLAIARSIPWAKVAAALRGLARDSPAALVCVVLAIGCPNWNRPRCERPGAFSCVADQPHLCSSTRELTPVGDEPCAAAGNACVVRGDGLAYCLPRRLADAGAAE